MDLLDITGVGPVTARLLNEAGMPTVKSVADVDTSTLASVRGIGPVKAESMKAEAAQLVGMTEPERAEDLDTPTSKRDRPGKDRRKRAKKLHKQAKQQTKKAKQQTKKAKSAKSKKKRKRLTNAAAKLEKAAKKSRRKAKKLLAK